MKILIIGYGSIGQRHFRILSAIKEVKSIDVVSTQNLSNIKVYKTLEDIKKINEYDYFIIASETYLHFEQLKFICSKVDNKIILVEKPIFSEVEQSLNLLNNRVLVAYNFRFHPVIEKLKDILKDKVIYYANIIAGQYLPTWRPNTDYKKSYSADINKGGGVLRDLSHELDYINYLFGDLLKINSINSKISNLEISSDDIFTAVAVTSKKIIINVTMDYISKVPIRRLLIHCKNETFDIDLGKNIIEIYSEIDNETITFDEFNRDYTYTKMHQNILNKEFDNICSYKEGINIVNIIDKSEYTEL